VGELERRDQAADAGADDDHARRGHGPAADPVTC
jgi:hypothetical protein